MLHSIDLPFGVDVVRESLEALTPDTGMVIGSKGHPDSRITRPAARRLVSAVLQGLLRLLFGMHVRDTQGSQLFRTAPARSRLDRLDSPGAFFQIQLVLAVKRAGLGIVEIPVRFTDGRTSRMKIVTDGWKSSRTWSARDSAATGCETRPTPPHQNPMRTNRLAMAILGLVALLVFHARVGLSVLDPRNVGWMQVGDWPHYLQGWSFYRWDSWRFPIGYFSNLLHPVGTSTGLTDSIPWLAMIFKIFNPGCPFLSVLRPLPPAVFLPAGFRRLQNDDAALAGSASPDAERRISDGGSRPSGPDQAHRSLFPFGDPLADPLECLERQIAKSSGVCCRKATALNLLAPVTTRMSGRYVRHVADSVRPAMAGKGRLCRGRILFVFWTLLQIVLVVLGSWVFGYLLPGLVEAGGFGTYAGDLAGFFDWRGSQRSHRKSAQSHLPPRRSTSSGWESL